MYALSGCRFLPQLAKAALSKALADSNICPPSNRALQQLGSVKCEQSVCLHVTMTTMLCTTQNDLLLFHLNMCSVHELYFPD